MKLIVACIEAALISTVVSRIKYVGNPLYPSYGESRRWNVPLNPQLTPDKLLEYCNDRLKDAVRLLPDNRGEPSHLSKGHYHDKHAALRGYGIYGVHSPLETRDMEKSANATKRFEEEETRRFEASLTDGIPKNPANDPKDYYFDRVTSNTGYDFSTVATNGNGHLSANNGFSYVDSVSDGFSNGVSSGIDFSNEASSSNAFSNEESSFNDFFDELDFELSKEIEQASSNDASKSQNGQGSSNNAKQPPIPKVPKLGTYSGSNGDVPKAPQKRFDYAKPQVPSQYVPYEPTYYFKNYRRRPVSVYEIGHKVCTDDDKWFGRQCHWQTRKRIEHPDHNYNEKYDRKDGEVRQILEEVFGPHVWNNLLSGKWDKDDLHTLYLKLNYCQKAYCDVVYQGRTGLMPRC